MPRLGELLVAAKILTAAQVDQALRAQVMWGGRLGTNLIELGYLDLDALSKAVAQQHKLPAALARHFEKIDRELQQKLSADVAERFSCVPLTRSGAARDMIAIASVAPLDARARGIVADELEVEPGKLVLSIAAELRVRYHLERGYGIPRGARFLRPKGKTIPPMPQFVIAPVGPDAPNDGTPEGFDVDLEDDVETRPHYISAPVVVPPVRAGTSTEIVDVDEPDEIVDFSAIAVLEDDELAVPDSTIEDEPTGKDRRRYIRDLGEAPEPEPKKALGRIAIRKVAVQNGEITAIDPALIAAAALGTPPAGTVAYATLGEATRAIRRGTNRDRVGDLVMSTIERFVPTCEAAMLLVVRGEQAVGWKSFHRKGTAVPEIGVPMCEPGLVPRVVQRSQSMRAPATDLTPIDQLLLVSLKQDAGDLVVVPVTIGGQVLCLVAMVCAADEPVASTETIAAAAGAAFARLMRDASR